MTHAIARREATLTACALLVALTAGTLEVMDWYGTFTWGF